MDELPGRQNFTSGQLSIKYSFSQAEAAECLEPYSQEEAERAAGMGSYIHSPAAGSAHRSIH